MTRVDPELPRITWLHLAQALQPAQLLQRGMAVDLALGGPVQSYQAPRRAWRRPRLGLALNRAVLLSRALHEPTGWPDLLQPTLAGLIALDDPCVSAPSLALLLDRLHSAATWAEGYADVVRLASLSAPFGRVPGTSLARLERAEIALAPTVEGPLREPISFLPLADGPLEGLAIVPGSRHEAAARRLIDALEARGLVVNVPETRSQTATASLLADLFTATLVEAQPELVEARAVLSRLPEGPRRAKLEANMVEPPPWPPASVTRLDGPDLVRALADQMVPGLEAHSWLLQSWERTPHPIDHEVLEAIAAAAGGRLVTEPRFRAWLRAEWLAWARQRYRRVAREAAAPPRPVPVSPGTSPS